MAEGIKEAAKASPEGTRGKQSVVKVVHLITGLDVGGAEMMLYQLLAHIDRSEFESEVISLTDIGPVGEKIQNLGVRVSALKMNRAGLPNPLVVPQLARRLREMQPDLVQTWMYHADLIGTLAARMAGNIPVIWNLQSGSVPVPRRKQKTAQIVQACARLSRRSPARIVSCSVAAREAHGRLGYATDKIVVIANGADVDAFHPDSEARLEVRRELHLDDSTPLIGMVGRFDPQKDHHNFVQAANDLNQTRPDVQYLLCGLDVTWDNAKFAAWIPESLRDRFHLLGRRQDIARLASAMDVGCLSSAFGEGFPMALNELMACGIPCVATDVGDCALLIGETGRIVPPRRPEALANAWRELIEMPPAERIRLGAEARKRVETHFSITKITGQYEALYREVSHKCAD